MSINRYRILTLSLLLTAAVMLKYSGLYVLIFAFVYLLRHDGLKPACMAVLLPLTAFAGWYLRCYALFGKLTTTPSIARYSALENIGGAVTTIVQFGGVILGCVLIEILISRLLSPTQQPSS